MPIQKVILILNGYQFEHNIIVKIENLSKRVLGHQFYFLAFKNVYTAKYYHELNDEHVE